MKFLGWIVLAVLLTAGALLMAGAPPAHADTPLPPVAAAAVKPAECKTVDDCRKVIAGMTQQIESNQQAIQTLGLQIVTYQGLLTESNSRLVAAKSGR